MTVRLKSYKDLLVWQKSMTMVKLIYELTRRAFHRMSGLGSSSRCGALPSPFLPTSLKVNHATPMVSLSSSFRTPKVLWPNWTHNY